VGGDADEIVMHPLGGLALARPPHRPLPSFITSAGGPAVTAALCVIFGVALRLGVGWVPWNPFVFSPFSSGHSASWFNVWRWIFWSYQTNYTLLMFNLLPIYPLDGGRMLQEALWPRFGYYKSMNFACITGMIGSIFGGAIALATLNIGLAILALCGFLVCLQTRRALLAAGPEEYADTTDYSAAYETFSPKPKRRPSRWAARRAMKFARAERQERQRIDQILAKVSAHGMQSLTWSERRALKKATEHQRQRDLEPSSRSPRS
jgi:Zn-dependent protease